MEDINLNDFPIHLKPLELDYELNIRGVLGLSNPRMKTSTLRELLRKENLGIEKCPKSSAHCCKSFEEIAQCFRIYDEVVSIAEQAIQNNINSEVNAAYSRLVHILYRLERVQAADEHEVSQINELLSCTVDAIHNITSHKSKASKAKATVHNRRSIPGAPSLERLSLESEKAQNSDFSKRLPLELGPVHEKEARHRIESLLDPDMVSPEER